MWRGCSCIPQNHPRPRIIRDTQIFIVFDGGGGRRVLHESSISAPLFPPKKRTRPPYREPQPGKFPTQGIHGVCFGEGARTFCRELCREPGAGGPCAGACGKLTGPKVAQGRSISWATRWKCGNDDMATWLLEMCMKIRRSNVFMKLTKKTRPIFRVF